MKSVLLSCVILVSLKLAAQDTPVSSRGHPWDVSLSFYHDFFVKGYVSVRENQYTGDKLSFANDLGMNQWNSASMQVKYTFKNQSAIGASYQYYFFSGSMATDKDIWFNGTHINCAEGISGNKTHLSKIEAFFQMPFRLLPNLETSFLVGFIYHRLIFRIDGRVLPDTYHNELSENFVSQALPYPQIGFCVKKNVSPKSSLSVQARGTYIPLFESFFYEGGDVHLHYYAANVKLSYHYSLKNISIIPSWQYSVLKTFEFSQEDTNDFFIAASGIILTAEYKF